MQFALIPAGEFMMGATENGGGSCCGHAENGPHRVRITKPYYLGVYPVTQDEFQQVMKTNPSWFSAQGGGKNFVRGMDTKRFPVEQVSWSAAQDFCKELARRKRKLTACRPRPNGNTPAGRARRRRSTLAIR